MLPSTKKHLFVSVILLVVTGACFAAMWYLVFLYKARVTERAAEYRVQEQKRAEVQALKKIMLETEGERAELNTFIVKDTDVTTVIGLVESIAQEQGLSVTTRSVTVETLPDSPLFELLSLRLEAEGEYDDLNKLVALVETLPFQVTIPSMSMSRVEEKEGEVWNGAFVIHVTKAK